MIKEIETQTTDKFDVTNINHYIEAAVKESGVKDGICIVYVAHATAAIIINKEVTLFI